MAPAPISHKNPHQWHGHGYAITWWHDNTACGMDGATLATVAAGGRVPYAAFRLPEQASELQHLRWLLESVFEAGQMSKVGELRKILGIV